MSRRILVGVVSVFLGCPSGTKISPVTVSSVTDPVEVSSIIQPVTVSAIQTPVAVATIGGAVAVSSVAEPLAVSSIAQPVEVSSVAQPVAVSAVGRIDSPVTVTGAVQVARPENDPDRIENGNDGPLAKWVTCGSSNCMAVGAGPFILTDAVLSCSSLSSSTVTFFVEKKPPDGSSAYSARWSVEFRCSGTNTFVASGLRLAARSEEKIYAQTSGLATVAWSGFRP